WTASNGIPRVVNLLCDRALFRAARSQTLRVDVEHVVWAVDDLKLPAAPAHTLRVPDQPGDGLASRVPLGDQPAGGLASRVPLGDQPGDGLASFREEFQDTSTEREDQD